MVEEQVISYLISNGPSLPVEIGKSIGYNSFITKAILLELTDKGLVMKSKRTIGGSLVYYIKGQEELLRKRLYNDLGIPDKKVLDRLKDEGQIKMGNLTPHERAFIKDLLDFVSVDEDGDDFLVTHYAYEPKKEVIPPEIKPISVSKKVPDVMLVDKKPLSGFDGRVKEFLSGMGEILSTRKIKTNSEYDYVIRVDNPFPQELFVKAKKKKSITENDLSYVYAEALKLKKPALIVTTGSLSKKTQQWKRENVGEIVIVVQIK